jgi:hypothetical protein
MSLHLILYVGSVCVSAACMYRRFDLILHVHVS